MPFGKILNGHGERLDYSVSEGTAGRRDVVVIGHGVTANKDREWAVTLAAAALDTSIRMFRQFGSAV